MYFWRYIEPNTGLRNRAPATSLQTPCRTAYGSRTRSSALFIKSFYI